MSTNNDVVTEAFRMSGILAESISLSAEQAADGLRVMNDMLADWDANRIDVGHIPQTDISDESPVYADALRTVKFNLAVEIANSYGAEVPPEVARIAFQTHARLLRDAVKSELKEADMSHLSGGRYIFDIETG